MNLKEIFEKENIPVEKLGEIQNSCDGIIVPVTISNETYFFKFLPLTFEDRVEREIGIVELLRKEDIKVPSYYQKNKQVLFKTEDQIFYASKKAPGKKVDQQVTKPLLEDIMRNIASLYRH